MVWGYGLQENLESISITFMSESNLQKATLGGGCFWCVEAVFELVNGFVSVESGYAGGTVPHPTYKHVCEGTTGHAEVCRVVFDPSVISYDDILRMFFSAHDPTTLNRQGNDVGTQYRSAVFWTNDEQGEIVERTRASFDSLIRERKYGEVTTEIGPADGLPFYFAEPYHQQYLYSHPNGYDCHSETGLQLPPL